MTIIKGNGSTPAQVDIKESNEQSPIQKNKGSSNLTSDIMENQNSLKTLNHKVGYISRRSPQAQVSLLC